MTEVKADGLALTVWVILSSGMGPFFFSFSPSNDSLSVEKANVQHSPGFLFYWKVERSELGCQFRKGPFPQRVASISAHHHDCCCFPRACLAFSLTKTEQGKGSKRKRKRLMSKKCGCGAFVPFFFVGN